MKKRILSLVLAISLCSTLLVTSAFAVVGGIGFDTQYDYDSANYFISRISKSPYSNFLIALGGSFNYTSDPVVQLWDDIVDNGLGEVTYLQLEILMGSYVDAFDSPFNKTKNNYT